MRAQYIEIRPLQISLDGQVTYVERDEAVVQPSLFWSTGEIWIEASLWLYRERETSMLEPLTFRSRTDALVRFGRWIESEKLREDWTKLPKDPALSPMLKFRKNLKKLALKQAISHGTASSQLAQVAKFMRWMQSNGKLSGRGVLEEITAVPVVTIASSGRSQLRMVTKSSLSIKRSRTSTILPEGLQPLSPEARDQLLDIALRHHPMECYLILAVGFFSGMRIGTITDLRVGTLERAVESDLAPRFHHLSVGPGAAIPVRTKFSVSGDVMIPSSLLDALRGYSYSARRLVRAGRSKPENRDVLFLTSRGNPYLRNSATRSSTVDVMMHRLRASLLAEGHSHSDFHFHQTRATFGTELALMVSQSCPDVSPASIVFRFLLQTTERAAQSYIRYINATKSIAAAGDLYAESLDTNLNLIRARTQCAL